MCSVNDCPVALESNIEFDAYIAANQHNVLNKNHQTASDIALSHLTNILRSTSVQSRAGVRTFTQRQATFSPDLSLSIHYESFLSPSWTLRKRKFSNSMSEFLEQVWHESTKTSSRIASEHIQEQIWSMRNKQWNQAVPRTRISFKKTKLNIAFENKTKNVG